MNKYQTTNKSKLETNLCSAIHRTHKLTNVKERHPTRCRVSSVRGLVCVLTLLKLTVACKNKHNMDVDHTRTDFDQLHSPYVSKHVCQRLNE